MKLLNMAVILLLLATSGVSFARSNLDSSDIAKAIPSKLEHPYLFFTEADKPGILDRIENDPVCHDIMAQLLAEANRLMYTPVKQMPPQPKNQGGQLFDTSSTEYDEQFSLYTDAAYKLAFVYQMTGDEKYARKAFEFAREVCDMRTWTFRAHQFNWMQHRVMPWNVDDDQVLNTYEIKSSDTTFMIAAAYDWLYPALTYEEKKWLRSGLMSNAITLVRGNYEFHWWATAYRCNWCTWVNNGLGTAALALLTETPQLTDVVAESYNRIYNTLDEVGVDGGWQEGTSYWGQLTRMSILFADALRRVSDGKLNLYQHPRLVDNPVNFPLYTSVPPNGSVNFEDAGSGHRVGAARLYNKLALETGSKEAAWMRNNWFSEAGGSDIFDLLWQRHSVEPGLPEQASIHFRTIDWIIMRSDFTDPDKVMIACKAGKNDDPHHGHLDIGQVSVIWKGKGYIADLGTAAYGIKYFDGEKYDNPYASSVGHNLIFVNGEQQIPGKRKDQPLDESIGGEVLEFRTGAERDYALLDPTNAYPKKELKSWRRHVIYEKPLVTVIVDEVESQRSGAEVEARFHSDYPQIPKDGYTLIDGESGDMALIPAADDDFSFRPGRHAYLPVRMQSRFQWTLYNGTVIHPSQKRAILAHVILPVENDGEAERVRDSMRYETAQSGEYTLSFDWNGRTYTYQFSQTNDGLRLK